MQYSVTTLIFGILIPFIGTTLGAASVFCFKKEIKPSLNRFLLGFSSGVMVAASIWSLLLPAIEMKSHMGKFSFVPAAIGFFLGVIILLIIDWVTANFFEKHNHSDKKETWLLTLAVTLHNLPEGMAVGVAFAAAMLNGTSIGMMGAMVIAIGIAVQNIPEGAIISMSFSKSGKLKAFGIGTLSGVIEPIAATITLFLAKFISPILPYLLALAAGAMIFVVIKELIPKASKEERSYIGIIGFTIGFLIMMSLDVAI